MVHIRSIDKEKGEMKMSSEQHPIEGLMTTAMNSIQDMIDVNTIIGEPIETSNNIVIIPISKVGFGFAAGGSEFKGETVDEYTRKEKEEAIQYRLPFGGGSGAGVNITPIAFLVIQPNNVRLLPVSHGSAMDKLLDYMPDLMDKLNSIANRTIQNKKEEKMQALKCAEKKRQQEEKEQKEEKVIKEVREETNLGPIKTRRVKKESKNYEVEYDETGLPEQEEEYTENDYDD